ncbi:MAG: recombination regulator RecX [Oscillospiraceae bacterium]|jgi:regulatory protein|nr:recombination regulator RecX [Oscillospiraceae bacterium]
MSYARKITAGSVSCYDKSLDLLARRMHSRAELERKLLDRGYVEDEVELTLDRLTDCRLLDDDAFARRQAERMMQGKGFAPRRIAQELRQRGVDGETIDAAVNSLEDYDPCAAISTLLERKFSRFLTTEQGRRRTVNALVRLGYGWQDIRKVMQNFDDTEDFCDE